MLEQYEEKMDKSLDSLLNEFASIRAGRANPHVLDKIRVDYYGQPTPLQQVANISVPEARTLMIQPWESSLIKEIEKAILCSDLGITPNKASEISEDELKDLEDKVQKLTDKYIDKVDKAVEEKTKEILTV